MNIVKTIDQYNEDYVYFCDPIKNNVMNNGHFIRIIYSAPLFVLNGIYLHLSITSIAIEKYYNILSCYIFIKGKNNFRKELLPTYKANRPPVNPIINNLYEYFKIAHQAIESFGAESEDYVYSVSKKIDNNGIILSIDHDTDEIPGIHYNYKKDIWRKITLEQARMSKYQKLIVSESGDNVNLAKGLGIKHFEKFYNSDMTEEEIESQLLKSYTKVWKTEELAKEKLELAKQLLYLKDVRI